MVEFTSFKPQYPNTSSPFLPPYINHTTSGEKLLKYQEKTCWVIISDSLILTTFRNDKGGYYREKFDGDTFEK